MKVVMWREAGKHYPRVSLAVAVLCVAGLITGGVFAPQVQADQHQSDVTRDASNESATATHDDLTKRDVIAFFQAAFMGGTTSELGLAHLKSRWQPSFIPMALESIRLSQQPDASLALLQLLAEKTGQPFGYDFDQWWGYIWARDERRHPHYAKFKSDLYALIDPTFAGYFDDAFATRIRLDEVRWGGVVQDGIPPLRQPKMIAADAADYLAPDNTVFGIEINGDARAYPKRILAWHEMFVDRVGGVDVAGVYCTLCGTVILYETSVNGTQHEMGTSGFLYRSNKLMYDKATQSLWSTMRGEPVIGELAESGIQLPRSYVVTSTWGEWKRRHPKTTVLSLDTGHRRDYGEGVAYRDYFATDELMFAVPKLDDRLNNKDEVLGLLFDDHRDQPVAIAASWLEAHPVHHDRIDDVAFVVLTDSSGANRVYANPDDIEFTRYDGDSTAIDAQNRAWRLSESALSLQVAGDSDGTALPRLPAHRAFWFGWYSAFPDTRLVQ